MDRRIRAHIVQPQVFVGAAVDADAAAESIGLFIDGLVALVAQVRLDAR